MKNLTELLTYVLELPKDLLIQTRLYKIDLYANFLNQNLNDKYEVNSVIAHPLNRFVPCDLEGNILVKPSIYDPRSSTGNTEPHLIDEAEINFYLAKKRVLFANCEYRRSTVNGDSIYIRFQNFIKISDLMGKKVNDLVEHSLELTETAKRMIGVSPN